MAVIYEAFRESRRIVDCIQQALTFCVSSSIFLSFFFLLNSLLLLPAVLHLVSLLLLLLLFIPLLSLSLLCNPKTDKLMKEYPFKPMDPQQVNHQFLLVVVSAPAEGGEGKWSGSRDSGEQEKAPGRAFAARRLSLSHPRARIFVQR